MTQTAKQDVAKMLDGAQLHYVIPQRIGGPNLWWNITPARFPDHNQELQHGGNVYDMNNLVIRTPLNHIKGK